MKDNLPSRPVALVRQITCADATPESEAAQEAIDQAQRAYQAGLITADDAFDLSGAAKAAVRGNAAQKASYASIRDEVTQKALRRLAIWHDPSLPETCRGHNPNSNHHPDDFNPDPSACLVAPSA